MPLFTYVNEEGYIYLRLGKAGYGIHLKDFKKHGLMFSQRYGHTKYIKVGKWIVTILKPYK